MLSNITFDESVKNSEEVKHELRSARIESKLSNLDT